MKPALASTYSVHPRTGQPVHTLTAADGDTAQFYNSRLLDPDTRRRPLPDSHTPKLPNSQTLPTPRPSPITTRVRRRESGRTMSQSDAAFLVCSCIVAAVIVVVCVLFTR